MYLRTLAAAAIACAVAAAVVPGPVAAEDKQYIPGLMYRSGPYAPTGSVFANGFADYFTLLNERDGGINKVKIDYVECDTAYNNDRGVECYERLKRPDAAAVAPLSTGITYAIMERTTADKIPLLSMGYGRTAAGDGRVFPYVFTMPLSYWAGADSMVTYIAGQEGGFDKLKGKKIALVHHDSAYGKEPIATLEALAAQHGFEFHKFAVPHPGLEQKATWLQIGRQLRPNWVVMWGWGVMNSTAVKEAAAVGFPMERFIGIWWSGAEQDVIPAGDAAKGYKALNFHGTGDKYPLHQDIYKYVHDRGKGAGDRSEVGQVLYNRGIINGVIIAEAIRTAQAKYGAKPLTGEQIRDGFEAINLTAERLAELGLPDFTNPIKVTCADHEGGGRARVQQWDGSKWNVISDWIEPNRKTLLRPMIEKAAAEYAAEKNVTPRVCPGSS
jgi:branched-chain amino acid transport system substrate-binding protein